VPSLPDISLHGGGRNANFGETGKNGVDLSQALDRRRLGVAHFLCCTAVGGWIIVALQSIRLAITQDRVNPGDQEEK
jgi:hypothetical protein